MAYYPPRPHVTNTSASGNLKVVESDSSETLLAPTESDTFPLVVGTGQVQLVIDGVTDVHILALWPIKGSTSDPFKVTESDNTVTIMQPRDEKDFVLGPSDQLIVELV